MPDLTDFRCDRCGQPSVTINPEKGANPLPAHQCWNTEEMCRDFNVMGFQAPLVVVKRKDGVIGSLEFTHMPRWYFNWREHK